MFLLPHVDISLSLFFVSFLLYSFNVFCCYDKKKNLIMLLLPVFYLCFPFTLTSSCIFTPISVNKYFFPIFFIFLISTWLFFKFSLKRCNVCRVCLNIFNFPLSFSLVFLNYRDFSNFIIVRQFVIVSLWCNFLPSANFSGRYFDRRLKFIT